MTLYDELIARGLIAQVTNEDEIKNMINNGKATFYIGFDCTADSLHVGHFMALCLMKRLQMAGNKPIALIGDGTTLIGDPSGRTDMRQMLTEETIKRYPLPTVESDVRDYYRNFVKAIRGEEKQLVTHAQMMRVVKLMEACFKSAEENAVVHTRI